MTNNKQDEILALISEFRELPGDRYNFLPVATEEEISRFEDHFDIRIPEEFRWFLLNVANGIEESLGFDFLSRVDFADFTQYQKGHNLARPFPLKKRFLEFEPEDKDDYPFEYDVMDDEAWDSDDDHFADDAENGIISLAAYGCGTYSFIVVNGEEYGNVWIYDIASNGEICPEYDKGSGGKRLTFFGWFKQRVEMRKVQYQRELQYLKEREEEERRRAQSIAAAEKKKLRAKEDKLQSQSFFSALIREIFGRKEEK